ncbi:zinc ribbon domain-containing protein [Methanobacterium spitsbergense]|uniref:Zinc ribbon domain-containing protein n=1 Tax=Methanobacterium spitsbergense TaxID=2874285 RepID=A0A8T5UXL3_9EURY|nr:zinc ribbon domain-containing protein [Methanobacterium spitsbergense]MBZ2165910.1 zinc ribbon domain-containing protein [Methanobacterium spitsbergense]
MGYLICNKCGGYYELKKGESIDDFDICECGGKFTFIEEIEGLTKSSVLMIKCPSCGNNNPEDSKYCLSCGEYMKPIKGRENLLDFLDFPALFIISILAVIIFILSSIIFGDLGNNSILFIDNNQPDNNLPKGIYLILIIFIGICAGLLVKGNYKKNALHGALVLMPSVIFGVVSFYSEMNTLLQYIASPNPIISLMIGSLSIVLLILMILAYSLLGGIGGLIGSIIHNKFKLDDNKLWKRLTEKIYHNKKINIKELRFGYFSFLLTILLVTLWSVFG